MTQFGLEKKHIKSIQNIFQNILDPGQSLKIWVFGSRATGTYKKYSDVDLIVKALPQFSPNQLLRIKDELEESDLPFKFDIVLEEKVYLPYKEKIDKEKKLFCELPRGNDV